MLKQLNSATKNVIAGPLYIVHVCNTVARYAHGLTSGRAGSVRALSSLKIMKNIAESLNLVYIVDSCSYIPFTGCLATLNIPVGRIVEYKFGSFFACTCAYLRAHLT